MEFQDNSADLEDTGSVRKRLVEIFVSCEDVPSFTTSKDFEQGDVKGDADSAVDSRNDLAEGVVTVSVRKLEVKIREVLF